VWLRHLRLSSFRNYSSLDLALDGGLSLFVGPNGSGKTSILEAVSYLAVARSLRGSRDQDVVRRGETEFGVGGELDDDGRVRSIVLKFAAGQGKEIRLDGEQLGKLSDLVGMLRVAWFGPDDTWITKGGPAGRRKLLDLTLCQLDPAYLSALSSYRRALRQRNEVLLSWSPDEDADRLLDVWTERLVEYGSVVVSHRAAFLPRFREAVSDAHGVISGDDSLALRYRSSLALEGADDRESVEGRFREALSRCEVPEKRSGTTMVGPHRDDLEVTLDGQPLRQFGSQGQHRTAAIALKLGEATVLDTSGTGAVVLLDDVLSELDHRRARALVELIGRYGQALMTSTERVPASVLGEGECAIFRVDSGGVLRE
jgi:DNA replication and repair protein RecF